MIFIQHSKNPKYNTNINPKYNANINPKYNAKINPKYNANINPKYNAKINPTYNANINPKYNAKINPKYNSNINPKYNTKLNPKYNRTINPNYARDFDGYLLFSPEGNILGYAIKIENIILFFNQQDENVRFGVQHPQNGYDLFDLDLNFTAHFESNSQNGFNEFNLNNEWLSYMI